jgi:hypothetical protein
VPPTVSGRMGQPADGPDGGRRQPRRRVRRRRNARHSRRLTTPAANPASAPAPTPKKRSRKARGRPPGPGALPPPRSRGTPASRRPGRPPHNRLPRRSRPTPRNRAGGSAAGLHEGRPRWVVRLAWQLRGPAVRRGHHPAPARTVNGKPARRAWAQRRRHVGQTISKENRNRAGHLASVSVCSSRWRSIPGPRPDGCPEWALIPFPHPGLRGALP